MDLIKITTEEKDLVSSYMNDIMSFDFGLIEIIIGWDIAKKRGATILNHKIDKNVYWTFSPREKRKIFEENIKSFVFEGIQSLLSEVNVNNLNPLSFKNEADYLNHLKEAIQGCDGYLYSERLYVYCGREIYHIDNGLLNFMSWDIINEIKEILNIKEIGKVPKILKDLDIKYIPYLNAKKSDIIGDVH